MLRKSLLAVPLLAAALIVPAAAHADSGLTPSVSSLDLGDIPAGQSYFATPGSQSIALTNTTANPITIDSVTWSPTTDWGWYSLGGTIVCADGTVVAAGDSCTITPVVAWHWYTPF